MKKQNKRWKNSGTRL